MVVLEKSFLVFEWLDYLCIYQLDVEYNDLLKFSQRVMYIYIYYEYFGKMSDV